MSFILNAYSVDIKRVMDFNSFLFFFSPDLSAELNELSIFIIYYAVFKVSAH